MRIGKGFDVHRFRDGGELVLGGVAIPHPRSLEGHSDADVLIHAVCDALLGAAALGDIGQLFPDTDPQYKGIRSELLLRECTKRVRERGFRIGNLDTTIFAEAPRLSPYKDAIRKALAAMLEVDPGALNVKAKTLEGIGALGKGAGMAAEAVVLLLEEGDD